MVTDFKKTFKLDSQLENPRCPLCKALILLRRGYIMHIHAQVLRIYNSYTKISNKCGYTNIQKHTLLHLYLCPYINWT